MFLTEREGQNQEGFTTEMQTHVTDGKLARIIGKQRNLQFDFFLIQE